MHNRRLLSEFKDSCLIVDAGHLPSPERGSTFFYSLSIICCTILSELIKQLNPRIRRGQNGA